MNHIRIRPKTRRASWIRIAGVVPALVALSGPSVRGWAQAPDTSTKQDRPDKPAQEDSEVKLGRQFAEENDKHVKLVTDSTIVERVNRIGSEIAAVANATRIPAMYGTSNLKSFHYTFKVVDDKDVNAYSLPGGFVYINTGLLGYIHSDDELAGVLGHEITHVMHHHLLKLMHEQNKLQNALTPVQLAAIAMILAGRGNGGQAGVGVLEGSQLYQVARINSYSVIAEKDADHGAILLLQHTHYNPVGLYSFMVRLASYERNHGFAGDMGILRDHPPGPERVDAAKKLLADLNIPIHVSEVDPSWRAVAKTTKVGGTNMAEISVHDLVVCRVVGADGMTAQARAEKLCKRLTSLIDDQLEPFEIRVSQDQSCVLARGVPFLTSADASAQGKTLDAIAHEMGDAVTQLNQKQQLELAL